MAKRQHPFSSKAHGHNAYFLVEAVELDYARVSQEDFDLIAPRRSAPLGTADVARVEGEGIAAASRFPAQAIFRESRLAALLGQIQVDVVKILTVTKGVRISSKP